MNSRSFFRPLVLSLGSVALAAACALAPAPAATTLPATPPGAGTVAPGEREGAALTPPLALVVAPASPEPSPPVSLPARSATPEPTFEPTPEPTAIPTPVREVARVVRVIDGDSARVWWRGEERTVRYLGIDAPEIRRPGSAAECGGAEALAVNQRLVEGKEVALEDDVAGDGRYGDLLRWVFLRTNDDEELVNLELVRGGMAAALPMPPNLRHQDRLAAAEAIAREDGAGLWGDCSGVHQRLAPITPTPAAPRGAASFPCAPGQIKGNRDSHIYHLPGGQFYATTSSHVTCFDSEQAAVNAGYRRSLR